MVNVGASWMSSCCLYVISSTATSCFFCVPYSRVIGSLDYIAVSVGEREIKQSLIGTGGAQCLFHWRALVCE